MVAKIRLSWGHRVEIKPPPPSRPPSFATVEAEAMAALADVAAALDAAGMRWWLTYGALLGMTRDGRLIQWDDDLDFAIAPGPRRRRMLRELRRRGFQRISVAMIDGKPTLDKFRRGPISLDFYLLRNAGIVWEDRFRYDDHSICISTHPRMAVVRRQFAGIDVAVPEDAEAYLVHLYGPEWRTPVSDWDYRHSPPNVTIHLSWWSGVLLLRRRVADALAPAVAAAARLRKATRKRLRRLFQA